MTMRDGNKCPDDACVIFKRCSAPGQCKAPTLCKVDGTPLCMAKECQREGRCMGTIEYRFDFTPRKTWRSAEAAAYGYLE